MVKHTDHFVWLMLKGLMLYQYCFNFMRRKKVEKKTLGGGGAGGSEGEDLPSIRKSE